MLSGQIDTAILHVDQADCCQKEKDPISIFWSIFGSRCPKWLYAAYIAPEKEIKENRQLYIDIMAALVKANRFIYNNKAKDGGNRR